MRSEIWRQRLWTLEAMVSLCAARMLIAIVPFQRWRGTVGFAGTQSPAESESDAPSLLSRRLAGHVERAAARLPIGFKCLPRAIALSWLLRRNMAPHRVAIAVRPLSLRDDEDALHAWVEIGGRIIMGDLPGPWHVVYASPE